MSKMKSFIFDLFDDNKLTVNISTSIQDAEFWTTDRDAYLSFGISRHGFVIDKATINLYNKSDKSLLIDAPMTIVNNEARFKLSSDVMSHFGKWSAQVIFNDKYTSPTVDFEILRALGSGIPDRIGLIHEWEKLNNEVKIFVAQIEGFTLEQFVENKMGEELANLEVNYATRLTGLESNDANLTAQLAQTMDINAKSSFDKKGIYTGYSKKGAITLIDDDGSVEFFNKLRPIALEYGIRFSSALVSDWIDRGSTGSGKTTMTMAQLKQLQAEGFEFLSHSKTHPRMAEVSETQMEHEFKYSREWMWKNGFDGSASFVYPFGSRSGTVVKHLKKYYESGVLISGQDVKPPLNFPELRRTMYASVGVTQTLAMIDKTVSENGWLILGEHVHYDTWSESDLRTIIEYALSNDLEFISVREGLSRFSDGTSPSQATVVLDDDFVVTHDMLIDKYPDNKISYRRMRIIDLEGFPDTRGGMLVTHKLSINSYNWYQELRVSEQTTSGNTTTFRRYPKDGTTLEWSDWVHERKHIPKTTSFNVTQTNWGGPVTVKKNNEGIVQFFGVLVVGNLNESSTVGVVDEDLRPHALVPFVGYVGKAENVLVGNLVAGFVATDGRVFIQKNALNYEAKAGDRIQLNFNYQV